MRTTLNSQSHVLLGWERQSKQLNQIIDPLARPDTVVSANGHELEHVIRRHRCPWRFAPQRNRMDQSAIATGPEYTHVHLARHDDRLGCHKTSAAWRKLSWLPHREPNRGDCHGTRIGKYEVRVIERRDVDHVERLHAGLSKATITSGWICRLRVEPQRSTREACMGCERGANIDRQHTSGGITLGLRTAC